MKSSPITRYGKTALVLAGGGLTGAVYEIGVLRAIDDLLVDRTVNDFDIYIGTSAGALVASMLANQVSPEAMLEVMDGTNNEVGPIRRRHIFSTNRRELFQWGSRLPAKLTRACARFFSNRGEMTFFDLLWSLTNLLPAGLYNTDGLEAYVSQVLNYLGQSNDFNKLSRELFIIATELDGGDRAIFGPGMTENVPISAAVAASSALPILYQPVRIGDEEFVDGGLRGNASLDLAIEHGASLIICINPLVPYKHVHGEPKEVLPKTGYLSDRGISSIADQSLRITTHAGLHYHIKQLLRSHPEVDIILIEPRLGEYQMFSYNIMHYSARLTVARYGFESATLDLAEDYPHYKQILARHGIPITRRLVIEEIAAIRQSGYDPEVLSKVLEAKTSACGHRRRNTPTCELTRTLSKLELTLNELNQEV